VRRLLLLLLLCVTVSSCRVARHVAPGEAVVSRVDIKVGDIAVDDNSLRMAILQKPYRRTFGFLPVSAWIWHPDTLSYWHRLRGRLGTAPAIYSEALTHRTDLAMQRVVIQQGFLDATVYHDTEIRNGKAHVTYRIRPGHPRYLSTLNYQGSDSTLQRILDADTPSRLLWVGQYLDRNRMESERQRITSMMRERGFWDFDRNQISYLADTLHGSDEVDLTCVVQSTARPWRIRKIHFVTNYDMLAQNADSLARLTAGSAITTRNMEWPGYDVSYQGEQCYLRDRVLVRNCYLLPGSLYSEQAVRNTYAAFSRLNILRYINVRVEPVDEGPAAAMALASAPHAERLLDCFIYLTPLSPRAVQFELDGTNTAGDLGFALGLTYQQRNAFRGSEAFTTHLKGSYEALSGNVEKLVNRNYQEYAAEVSLDFPQFLFPFISDERRRRNRATSAVKASFTRQSRPEYSRYVAQGGFGYKWSSPFASARHSWDVIDLSYVYLPQQSEAFQQVVEKLGPLIYSSYTSHFILGTNYTLHMGNSTLTTGRQQQTVHDLWYLRINPELAGSTLTALSALIGNHREGDDRLEIFGQPFEQYARFDFDWSYNHFLTERSRLALHGAGGVAVPFGNSSVMPFEKRYYSGGANSVRGWSVRELGPGSYASQGATYNYFNQCGDIRLDASVELRTRLVGGLESALFVDAGNVWTIRDYENQPGGRFTSDFYRQIASSWGVGLRLISDFMILRLDWGFKAYDPSSNADRHWALPHPFSKGHNTLHFAVGYPF